jgi:hypothetical protein
MFEKIMKETYSVFSKHLQVTMHGILTTEIVCSVGILIDAESLRETGMEGLKSNEISNSPLT